MILKYAPLRIENYIDWIQHVGSGIISHVGILVQPVMECEKKYIYKIKNNKI